MKTRAAVCRAFGAPLDRGDGRTRRARAGRGADQDRRLRDLPQRHLLHGRGLGRRIAGGLRPRGGGGRRGGRRGRQAAEGRRPCGGDAHPQLRLLPRLRRGRAGLLRGGVPARPLRRPLADGAGKPLVARAAHRRLRRAHGRRPVAGGRNPEGHAARQRRAHRLRRADGLRRGRQHRQASRRARASSSSAAAASASTPSRARGSPAARRSSPSTSSPASSPPRANSAQPRRSTPRARMSPSPRRGADRGAQGGLRCSSPSASRARRNRASR